MNRLLSASLIGTLLLALNGCATQNCDPRYDAGFFGTIGCHASGAYKDRQTKLDAELGAESSKEAKLHSQMLQTKAKQDQVAVRLAALEAELAGMDKRLSKAQAHLAQNRRASESLKRQIAATRSAIQHVQHSSQPESEKIRQRDALKKRVEELEREAKAVQ